MTDWKDPKDTQSQDEGAMHELLQSLTAKWSTEPGFGDATLQVFIDMQTGSADPVSTGTTERLTKTLLLASKLRQFSREATSRLSSSRTFGEALLSFAGERCEIPPSAARIQDAATPIDVGLDSFRALVKDWGVPFLGIFTLVAVQLEHDFVRERDGLIAEGLGRTDLTNQERAQEEVEIANSILDNKRREYVTFLKRLARVST